MKNFELKDLGVTEMSHTDAVSVEGGSWLSRVWGDLKQGFIDGWNAVKDFFN